jgi:hypothetical protein
MGTGKFDKTRKVLANCDVTETWTDWTARKLSAAHTHKDDSRETGSKIVAASSTHKRSRAMSCGRRLGGT